MDDADVQAQLAELHPASYGWALSCCARDAAQAEDVLQTVYLKVLDGRARFDGRSALKTWLFAVIRRTAADERRRNWLRQLKLVALGNDSRETVVEDRHGEALDQSEMQTMFQQALVALPQRQQQVLHLVFYQEVTIEQAAEVLGISVGSARTHYARGKERLREWLTESEVFHETGFARKQNQAALR